MAYHETKFAQENEAHKILWDLETQTDHLFSARRLNLVLDYFKKRERELVVKWILPFQRTTAKLGNMWMIVVDTLRTVPKKSILGHLLFLIFFAFVW